MGIANKFSESIKSDEKAPKISKNVLHNPNVRIQQGYGFDRKSRISNCKICKGNPEPVPFCISGFEGTRCKECYEIINYSKVQDGKPVKK